jgi:hypothetical protein
MDDTPGADGCITDKSLNGEFKVELGGSIKADKEGI